MEINIDDATAQKLEQLAARCTRGPRTANAVAQAILVGVTLELPFNGEPIECTTDIVDMIIRRIRQNER